MVPRHILFRVRCPQAISTYHTLQRGHPECSSVPRRLTHENRGFACKGKLKRRWLPAPFGSADRISVQYCAADADINTQNGFLAVLRASFKQAQPRVKRFGMQPSLKSAV